MKCELCSPCDACTPHVPVIFIHIIAMYGFIFTIFACHHGVASLVPVTVTIEEGLSVTDL